MNMRCVIQQCSMRRMLVCLHTPKTPPSIEQRTMHVPLTKSSSLPPLRTSRLSKRRIFAIVCLRALHCLHIFPCSRTDMSQPPNLRFLQKPSKRVSSTPLRALHSGAPLRRLLCEPAHGRLFSPARFYLNGPSRCGTILNTTAFSKPCHPASDSDSG